MHSSILGTEQEQKICDARAVANEVIRLAHAKYAPITNLEVLKLTYFSHGFMLGIHSMPIFYQPIIAWKYGPVVIDVYESLKHNGAQPVPGPIQMPGLQLVEDTAQKVIGYTYELLGSLSSSRLVAISHDVNGPWYKTWNNSVGQNQIISNELMQEYFSGLLN